MQGFCISLQEKINKELPLGWPFTDSSDPSYSSMNQALDFFEENKYPSISEEAIRPYRRLVDDIREWAIVKKFGQKRINVLTELNAVSVLKFIWDKRNISNNYRWFLIM